MTRCKNCKFYVAHVDGFGVCTNDVFIYGSTLGSFNVNALRKDMVLYTDGEGSSATVEIGYDFGCVHGEEGDNGT